MSTPTTQKTRDRVSPAVVLSLTAVAIVAGLWVVTGVATTWFPALAVPAAAGLPELIPPLRLVPLGRTTWAFWAADTVAFVAMIVIAWLHTRAAHAKRPAASRARVFARALGATVWGVVAANLLRGVYLSFTAHADLGTFASLLAANVVVSAITGALLGLVVAAVATLVVRPARQQLSSE